MKTTKLILALAVLTVLVHPAKSDFMPPSCTFTWAAQTPGVTTDIYCISAVDENICWIAGVDGKVRRTTNGGVNWLNANTALLTFGDDIYTIWAIDENNAILATWNFTSAGIYKTTNGGANWHKELVQPGGFINSIIMKDANTGFAYGDPVGNRWSLWKTTNAGTNWDSAGLYLRQAGSEAGWNNSMCIVNDTIWFGTNNSRIYRSTNFGATGSWTACFTVQNVNTYGVFFRNGKSGLCIGTVVGKTTNGGATWFKKGQPGGTGNITAISGRGKKVWAIRGNIIYGSTNFGKNWNGTGFTASQNLLAINIAKITGCAAGWCSGNLGTIIKLTGTGAMKPDDSNEEDEDDDIMMPDVYELSQNYPNPFNPVTSIQYSIPKAGYVKLIVYDLLGKEIKTLVNENLEAGNYKADFDASKLASGVYLYRISAGNFTDIRKMVLIK